MSHVYGKTAAFVSIFGGFYAQQGPETLHKFVVRNCVKNNQLGGSTRVRIWAEFKVKTSFNKGNMSRWKKGAGTLKVDKKPANYRKTSQITANPKTEIFFDE